MNTDYEYFYFTTVPMENRKTPIWTCISHHNGAELGQVRWCTSFLQFCFYTKDGAILSPSQLADLQDFVKQVNAERRASRRKKRAPGNTRT